MSEQRVSRGPLLRCHGVQECILLVTQRISKYPVLIQRILDNTTGEWPQSQCFYCQFTYLHIEIMKQFYSQINQATTGLCAANMIFTYVAFNSFWQHICGLFTWHLFYVPTWKDHWPFLSCFTVIDNIFKSLCLYCTSLPKACAHSAAAPVWTKVSEAWKSCQSRTVTVNIW